MKFKNIAYLILAIGLHLCFFSCEDDEVIEKNIEFVDLVDAVVNLGDVPAGGSAIGVFKVKGIGLDLPIFVSISGDDGFTVDEELFPAANIVNEGNIILLTSREERGPKSAVLKVSGDGIDTTVSVVANIVEPLPLDPGTQIYFNGFEFGLDDGTAIGNLEIVIDEQVDPTVIASTTVALSTDPSNLGQERDLRSDTTFARCEDGSFSPPCGEVLELRRVGTTLNVDLIGLEPNRAYIVSYFVLPGGNSSRGLNVTVTGDTTPIFDDLGGLGGRSAGYQTYERTGIADANGELTINIVYTNDGGNSGSGRSLAFEDLKVIAGPL